MRVYVNCPNLAYHQTGILVGLTRDERDDVQAVVRLDGWGLMLHICHPTRVTPLEDQPLLKKEKKHEAP
jgi:hypothetical protein